MKLRKLYAEALCGVYFNLMMQGGVLFMNETAKSLNELLVNIFNDILIIEQKVMNVEGPRDLSITEMHTIEAIGQHHTRNMTMVAVSLKITLGTLTATVNNLVKKGYVERSKIEQDRRIVQIQLTDKGKIAYKIHEKFHIDMVNDIIDKLSFEEEKVMIKALDNLNNFFKARYEDIVLA